MRFLHPAHEQELYAVVLHYIPQHQFCHDEVPTCVNHVLAKCVPPGSTLLLYTDGVTDACDPQGMFLGLEWLYAYLRACVGTPAQVICDQLLHALTLFQDGAPQHDDVTLVALRAVG